MLTIIEADQRKRAEIHARAEAFSEALLRQFREDSLHARISRLTWENKDLLHKIHALKGLALTAIGKERLKLAMHELNRAFWQGLVEHAMPELMKVPRVVEETVEKIISLLRMAHSFGAPEGALLPATVQEAFLRLAEDREIDILPRGPELGTRHADTHFSTQICTYWPAKVEYSYMILQSIHEAKMELPA